MTVFFCVSFFRLFFLFVGGRKEQTSLSYSINYFKENTAGVDLPQVCGCVCVERERERTREKEREREEGETQILFVGSLRETHISYDLHFTYFGCGQIRKSE
jgi:hypothetical protein